MEPAHTLNMHSALDQAVILFQSIPIQSHDTPPHVARQSPALKPTHLGRLDGIDFSIADNQEKLLFL